MANLLNILNKKVNIGDVVKVHQKVLEKGKERIQIFSGLVIAFGGNEQNRTFTVRRIASQGIGVERIWPINSPMLVSIDIKRKGKVRRAKLYYLRGKIGKQATKIETKKQNKGEIDIDEKLVKPKENITNEKSLLGKIGRKSSPKISSK